MAAAATVALLPAAPAPADGPRPLLPDLRSRPQDRLTFSTIGIFGGTTVNGCFADEIVEDGARRCLRFDQSIANLGEGPFELRYHPPDYLADPYMYQRIYRSNGTWEDRKAEEYEFHPTHAHFHYQGFAQSRLWRSDASGARLGGAPVREGRKNGFCIMDIEKVRPDAPESRYHGDGCTATTEWMNGITPGWADTYTADLPDQYIEVTGVEDGLYRLETEADPDDTVVELSETNNAVSILIRIKGAEVEHLGTVAEPAPPPAEAPPPPANPPPPTSPPYGQQPPPPSGGHAPEPAAAPKRAAPRRVSQRRRCKTPKRRATPRRKGTASAKRKPRRCKRARSRTRRS